MAKTSKSGVGKDRGSYGKTSTSKGSSSRPRKSGSERDPDYYENDYVNGDKEGGRSQVNSYKDSSYSKGGSDAYGGDGTYDTYQNDSPKGGQSGYNESHDAYQDDDYSKDGGGYDSSYEYPTEDYGNAKREVDYYEGSEDYEDTFTKGGHSYGDDYTKENDYSTPQSKGEGDYPGPQDYGSNGKNISFGNDSYENHHEYSNSKDGDGYGHDEPINDPPYDGDDAAEEAKQPHTDRAYNPSKNEDNNEPEADMVFTEEEVYGEDQPDTPTSRQGSRNSTIRRVWVWAGGAVPGHAIGNPRSAWWRNRFALGMTDYIIALNDHDFSDGLGIKSNYVDPNNSDNRWAPICEILTTIDSADVAPHLMVFFPPHPGMIREAADVLSQILENSQIVPRSIQLDLEGWWTRSSARERSAGEHAIQEHFIERWSARRPELGIGITCIGSVPQPIYGAMGKVDFAIPQMYASERNYGRPISENSVRRHFTRAAEALGSRGKVIVGQTAYSRYVNPQIMKEMLGVLLRQHHPNSGGVSEIAYWSDVHLMNSSRNRQFFQQLTNLVRQEGLNRDNFDRL